MHGPHSSCSKNSGRKVVDNLTLFVAKEEAKARSFEIHEASSKGQEAHGSISCSSQTLFIKSLDLGVRTKTECWRHQICGLELFNENFRKSTDDSNTCHWEGNVNSKFQNGRVWNFSAMQRKMNLKKMKSCRNVQAHNHMLCNNVSKLLTDKCSERVF